MKYIKTYEDHFTGPDEEFIPSIGRDEGEISIQYLEEVLEWLYYSTNLDNLDKYERMLQIEEMIQNLLDRGKFVSGKLNYRPTWSKKLENEVLTYDEILLYKNTKKYNL